MLDPIHNQGHRLCLGAFQTSPVESLYIDAHEPCLGARRARISLQYATKIKSLPNHPAHNAVFDHKYMKLFDARLSAICTFGLRIKQFLTASNIDFSDILETPSYVNLPPWCVKPPKIVLDLVHLKKDRTYASIYQQFFFKIEPSTVITFLFIQMDHGHRIIHEIARFGIYFHCRNLGNQYTLEEIKNVSASKFIIFTDSLSCLQALLHMKLIHPLIGMAIRKCVFLNIANKDIIFCWVPSHVGIKGNKKGRFSCQVCLGFASCPGWCTLH